MNILHQQCLSLTHYWKALKTFHLSCMIESFRKLSLVLVILVCRGGRIWCIFIITNKGVKAGMEGRKAVHRPRGHRNYRELALPRDLGLSVWVESLHFALVPW